MPSIPAPAGVVVRTEWEAHAPGEYVRYFAGTARETASGIQVEVHGHQWMDGTVHAGIIVDFKEVGGAIDDAKSARELARHILELADEIETLNSK